MRPKLHTLSQEMIQRILDEAMRVLAETGMEIRGAELKQRLQDHGLKTDAGGRRVLFPADVVRKAIHDAPSSFTLYNRDGDPYTDWRQQCALRAGFKRPEGTGSSNRRDPAVEFHRFHGICAPV